MPVIPSKMVASLARRARSVPAPPLDAVPSAFSGIVFSLPDGDGINFLLQGNIIPVRLWGVDAPESNQPGGRHARAFLSHHIAGLFLLVHVMDKDRYGRVVGNVFLPSGFPLSLLLVLSGHAWHYRRFAPEACELATAQRLAQMERAGLWRDPHPIPPWQWRAHTRRQKAVSNV